MLGVVVGKLTFIADKFFRVKTEEDIDQVVKLRWKNVRTGERDLPLFSPKLLQSFDEMLLMAPFGNHANVPQSVDSKLVENVLVQSLRYHASQQALVDFADLWKLYCKRTGQMSPENLAFKVAQAARQNKWGRMYGPDEGPDQSSNSGT
mmetsp:Transcript_37045/g.98508  ORF Transcript_37045/g.98508 Transcript_37045/m.98508 type:complete len:149 (+) Transcript_37045:1640-2086(+)